MTEEVAVSKKEKDSKEKEEAISKELEDKKAGLQNTENKIKDLLE